ncbi:glycosyltransferase [Alienimonas sp. DA493]|uniref:glycosyltransferase n=1 Tax=Alienimonas sp. DA493 TaxID=3373605 RepID=UPI0037543456
MSPPDVMLAHHWICREPRILHCAGYHASAVELVAALPPGRIHLIVTDWWSRPPEVKLKWVDELLKERSDVKPILLAQREADAHALRKAGPFPVETANQNGLVDERLFRPGAEEPEFDAVYTARPSPFKRHELASDVDSLLLICRATTSTVTEEHFARVRRDLPRAEYALCGLPVVSTPSEGGREEVFSPQYARIVPPAPGHIAAAVRELAGRRADPGAVRQAALDRLLPHRRRFIDLCQRIYDEEGAGRDFARDFYGSFFDKMLRWGRLSW